MCEEREGGCEWLCLRLATVAAAGLFLLVGWEVGDAVGTKLGLGVGLEVGRLDGLPARKCGGVGRVRWVRG